MSTFFDIRNWFEFGIDAIEIGELETPRLKVSGTIEQPVWTLLQDFAALVPCLWFIGEHAVHTDGAEAAIERLISSGVAWETRRFPGFGKFVEASAEFQGSWGNRGFVFHPSRACPGGYTPPINASPIRIQALSEQGTVRRPNFRNNHRTRLR